MEQVVMEPETPEEETGKQEQQPAEGAGEVKEGAEAKVEGEEGKPADPPAEESEEAKAKKEERRRTFQTRIDQLTRRAREAEERAEFYRQQYEEVAKPIQREQFATDDEFEAEKMRRHIQAEAIAVASKGEMASGSQAAIEAYRERVAEFSQDHPDWFDVVSKLVTTPQMESAIVESPRGAEISYYLAKHPGEAARIARLSPQAQDREIVRLESRELFETPKPIKSSAPPPIKPIPPVSKAPTSGDDEFSRWVAERNAKNKYGA